MAKKKAKKPKAAPKKKALTAPELVPKEKSIHYMVHIADPKMLRKDLLEGLREIIIFMQGYENFRRVQEEKVATFARLKAQVRELNSLIENRLRKQLPKGTLKPERETPTHQAEPKEEEEETEAPTVEPAEEKEEKRSVAYELDKLESQLQNIENQLKRF